MPDEIDEFVPDSQVFKELNITSMSGWRWDHNPELIALGWPPPVYINKRKYRSRKQLEQFKAALVQNAIEQRRKSTARDDAELAS